MLQLEDASRRADVSECATAIVTVDADARAGDGRRA